ncbi:hypothetical protein CVIRNUC_005785 [Coccomyxa viridis]|uniref:Cytochrome P450 n=1 Tax=Coccomyxa viridis TaxID=1274662 RepID=A0AAV1I7T6_9CHLO|nr:hypothetical protein CVIRNUC_005785 [Coccomyxa viridis]
MSCSHGCGVPCTVRISGNSQHDLMCNVQIRMVGPALTSLKTFSRSLPNPSGGPSRGVGIAAAAAAQRSAHDRSDGTLAETLIDGVTQSLALGLSAVSIAADSLARIQRVVAPLPAGFPPGPGSEVALNFLRSPLEFIDSLTQQYGSTVGLKLGGEQVVLTGDLCLSRQVLIDQADVFGKEGTAFFPGSSLAGNGLLVSDGPIWQRQRQLSNPAFRQRAVETYAKAMTDSTEAMLATQWQHSGRRDVYKDFNALTLQVTTQALFGDDLPAAEGLRVTGAIQRAFEYFAGRAALGFIIPEWLPTPDNLQYREAVQQLDSAVYSIIDSRSAKLATAPATGARQCLLDQLLLSKDEQGRGMNRRALRDELMTLLVAGQETSAILLGWACAFLAQHPEVQLRAVEEVQQVAAGALLPADVNGMRYLQAVVLETLRLRPPAYIVGRCAQRPVQLGAFSLPAGTTVLVSPWVLHRDSSVWQEPEAFKPERWMPLLETKSYMSEMSGLGSNGAYVPFGAGPRNCIGTGFAMMEALLVLAAILQRVQLRTVPGEGFPSADPRITLRPAKVPLFISAL